MGSGAKIALVALLILMVVAVAKFVQNGKDDDGGTPQAKNAAGTTAKGAANGPRLVDPKNAERTPGKGQVIGRQPISGGAGVSVAKSPNPGLPPPATFAQAGQTVPAGPTGQPGSIRPPAESKSATLPQPPHETPGAAAPAPASSAGGTPVPISPGPLAGAGQPETKRVEGTIAPPKTEPSDPPRAQREEGKTSPGTGGPLVSLDRPKQAERESPAPAPQKSDPPAPGIFSAIEEPSPKVGPTAPGGTKVFPASHVVEAGESYWRIAEKYYGTGNGRLHTTIAAANGGGKLIAGKTIKIPAPPPTPPAVPKETGTKHETPQGEASKTQKTPPPAGGIVSSDAKYDYYQVQKGDTLTGIAKRFLGGAGKVAAIEAANPSLRYETLREGARIRIPKK